jgi:hypothetical protein
MTLNPLKFAQDVNHQYLLLKGPYVSISRAFEGGKSVRELIKDKLLHPKMETIIRGAEGVA